MSHADPGAEKPGDDGEQSFISHLIELRERLLKAVTAVMIVLLCLLPFANRLYGWLALPLVSHLPQGGTMIAIEVIAPFLIPVKFAFFVALVLAMPVVLYQLWAFVAPGLYKHEKRLAVPILASAVVLFYIGCAFAYFLVLPAVAKFTAAFAPAGVTVSPDIGKYLDFALLLFLAFGLCFEIPVVLLILVVVGVVTPAQLVESRRYAIVASFVAAAFLTPPDALSMLMLAIPMCLLYELGIVGARVLIRPAADDRSNVPGA
ncbi:MAG: twin-arginine translocase subunit TatC [Rudaea sp.]|uniref:twin-arginine translocase subunit TatC n=1 Tax=Rudaea sp. TaxID=2136325 RepID=UPI0039E69AC9